MNCFGKYAVADCSSKRNCAACQERHHSTIHDVCAKAATTITAAPTSLHAGQTKGLSSGVLLATARVFVDNRYNQRIMTRALIDPGSEVSLVTEALVQRLRLPRKPTSTIIVGVGGKQTGIARGRVSITLSSRFADFTTTISALVLPRITRYEARAETSRSRWEHLKGLPLADPDGQADGAIALLLGADVYASIIDEGIRKGGAGAPIAQKTSLGWLVSGAIASPQGNSVESLQCSVDEELSSMVRKFWEQEETVHSPLPLTEEEQACEDHYVRTHSRLPDGRYMVRLPFKNAPPNLSGTRRIAMRMLQSMERKTDNDPDLHKLYSEFMQEYEDLGHMARVLPAADELDETQRCYLPHHGVLKKTNDTVKIRVVFNGSARLGSGDSLNSHLLTGPNLLPALTDVLLRWRRHRYVIIADIQKMYRQISLHPSDRTYQRILWRLKNSPELLEMLLTTVTYGLASSPFQAIRTMRQLAKDERHAYPRAASILEEETYVDDVLSGADTEDDARELVHELTSLCMAGGFPLQKWAANKAVILKDVPTEHRQVKDFDLWDQNASHATLGVQWHPQDDTFGFKVRPVETTSITKRTALSHTARLFDPLGWLAPAIILAKMLIQTAWLQHLDWDELLPPRDQQDWQQLLRELPMVEAKRIPRWLHTGSSSSRLEIHGFADASERAYAAVIYLKASTDGGRSVVTLLTAKSKVAPVKRVTLPRLELSAAAMLTRLAAKAQETLKLVVSQIHLYSDSEVTLAWIRGHPSRWTTYVANRVAEIQQLLPEAVWHHVPSRDNPADCASRGMQPSELVEFGLWWQGPSWLTENSPPPLRTSPRLAEDDVPERRAHINAVTIKPPESDMLLRFSTLRRLLRVSAWCRRWLRAIQARQFSVSGTSLTPQELEGALGTWIREAQAAWFSEEIKALDRDKQIPRRSALQRLSPFLDHDHVLRVGGRLKHAILSDDERHPAILPRDSRLTTLIIHDQHRRTLHGGVQLTLASLRQRIWNPGGRARVRQCIHQCITCVRWRAKSPQQLMADLPTIARAFTHTGVDYAGPIALHTTRGRGHKAYKGFLAIFVCMSTRAVHLEVVSDLTTDAFLAAFRRFTSRRGLCEVLYSDRGTNFVGADKELRRFFKAAIHDNPQWTNLLTTEGVRWKFNPPSAPHMGGLWEAAVKSVKHHLRRVVGSATLTYEEMATLLSQIEACLNSRPLQALSDDPEDVAALTPGHFLIGTALIAVPEPSLSQAPTSHLARWQHLQQMRDHFWERWAHEYLQTLHERSKWRTKGTSCNSGDLCIIRSKTTPPCQWPLARITEVHPGEDGQVRVVTARTATTTLTRPVAKIIPLPQTGDQHQTTSS
ncbi:uncharacterized protein [Temnothorax longispinosus]|uniref:uncharacterized protein n=1 Tax=Temnothorax longispinosus TaxID=300112 RepID=UPI003A99BC08